jgi:electron transfer flavoprotein beta subunit
MPILVPIKRVIDYNVRIRVKPDGSGVETQNVKMSINPFDEIAVEEAVRLREKNHTDAVVVVTIGPAVAQDVLRNALALGADRAIHVVHDGETQPLGVAKTLAALVARDPSYNLIIMGKQAIDDDFNQTGQMLAQLLHWPVATFASKLEWQADGIHVTREIDGGLQTLALNLPAVVTTDLRLNTPRFASLPNIMKAKSKPLQTMTPAELGVDLAPRLKTLRVEEPAKRSAGIKVDSVKTLVEKLQQAGVL